MLWDIQKDLTTIDIDPGSTLRFRLKGPDGGTYTIMAKVGFPGPTLEAQSSTKPITSFDGTLGYTCSVSSYNMSIPLDNLQVAVED